jgi:hypothetical protein
MPSIRLHPVVILRARRTRERIPRVCANGLNVYARIPTNEAF